MKPLVVTHEALNAWARTVPPHSVWWISDELWERIWLMLRADMRFTPGEGDDGYRYPLIGWRPLHENVRIGRMSAYDGYLKMKGRI